MAELGEASRAAGLARLEAFLPGGGAGLCGWAECGCDAGGGVAAVSICAAAVAD